MRKADKIKLSVMVGVSLLAFVVGCVDTAVQPIPTSIDYKSEVNVVNLAKGTGTATVSVFNAVVDQAALDTNNLKTQIDYSSAALSGTADFGSALPASTYQVVPSGGKAVVVSYANIADKDTFRLTANSQYKMRLFIVGDASTRQILKSTERYIWQTPGSTEGASLFPSGSGGIRVVNGSVDSVSIDNIEIKGGSVDTTVSFDPLAFKAASSYIEVPSGTSYTLTVTAGSIVNSVTLNPGSQKRYTVIVYDDAANLKVKVLTDD